MRRLNRPTDVFWVKENLPEIGTYDIVLLDTAAAITVYSLNALVASHYVIIPTTPEYQPILGAEQTDRTATMVQAKLNPDLHPPYFLLTQTDMRKRNHQIYRAHLRKRYRTRVLRSEIRTSAALSIQYGDGTTIFEHDPYSRGAHDYQMATNEILFQLRL